MSSNFVALVCSFLKEVAKSKRRRNRKITYKNSYIFLISDGTLYVFETAKPVSITALFKIGNQESASETFYIDISLFKTQNYNDSVTEQPRDSQCWLFWFLLKTSDTNTNPSKKSFRETKFSNFNLALSKSREKIIMLHRISPDFNFYQPNSILTFARNLKAFWDLTTHFEVSNVKYK